MSEKKNGAEPLRIVGLEVDDVLRIRALRVRPGGRHVVITGKNDQGKSSVLRSIAMALGGKSEQPPRPTRDGTEKAKVVVDLGDLIVKWSRTSAGSYLSIEGKDGTKFKSPQLVLDRLLGRDGGEGRLALDPLAFARAAAGDQRRTLAKLAGIDLAAEDLRAGALEETRRDARKKAEALRRRATVLGDAVKDAPPEATREGISTDEIAEELRVAEETRSRKDRARDGHRMALGYLARLREREDRLVAELQKVREEVGEAEARVVAEERKVSAIEDPDVDEILGRLRAADRLNGWATNLREADAAALAAGDAETELVDAEDALRKFRDDLGRRVRAAELPVPGLSIEPAGVCLDGIPLEQLSSSRALEVSLAVAFAGEPRLRVVLIDRAELLDEENWSVVERMAAEKGFQVWATIVRERHARPTEGRVAVHIVDGEAEVFEAGARAELVSPAAGLDPELPAE